MLSDEEAQSILESRKHGANGPALARWVDELLQDRRERIEQLTFIRVRLTQAYEYLNKLFVPKTETSREAKEKARRIRNA